MSEVPLGNPGVEHARVRAGGLKCKVGAPGLQYVYVGSVYVHLYIYIYR